MALTRSDAESVIVKRTGNLMAAAGLAVTVAGSNADLNDALALALRRLGYSVASRTAVTDADLDAVGENDEEQLLDVAELRTLESIQQNLDVVDIADVGGSVKLGQLSDRVEKAIVRKRAMLEREYGLGLGTLEAGVVGLGIGEVSP